MMKQFFLAATLLVFFTAPFVKGGVGGALSAPPARVVSLAPSATETLFAMGLGGKVVAVTDFCDRPAQARLKPRIGGMLAPSLEAIVKLAPDVAVLSAEGNPLELKKRLEGLGIRTYMFGEKRLDEFPAGIRRLGEALSAREGAEKAAEEIESAIKGIKERNKRRARLKALYIIWPEPLIAAGRGSAISDAMEVFNLENIADGAPSSYPKFSLEEIMRRSPDVIFFGGGHENMKEASQRLLGRLPTVSAVKNGRIYYASDYLNRLSPGFIKGMEEMELLLTGSRETSPAPQADEPEDE